MEEAELRRFSGGYECPVCKFYYVPSIASDWDAHAEAHQFVVEPLEPIPFDAEKYMPADQSPQVFWPNSSTDESVLHRIRQYAAAFKREMRTDFIQWSIDYIDDDDFIRFLLVEKEKLVGGGAFLLIDGGWRLDWIWISPTRRRSGILREIWPSFKGAHPRLSCFVVAEPVSQNMKNHLIKVGWPMANQLREF